MSYLLVTSTFATVSLIILAGLWSRHIDLGKGAERIGSAADPAVIAPFSYATLGALLTLNLAMVLWDRVSGMNAVQFVEIGIWRDGLLAAMRLAALLSLIAGECTWLEWGRPANVVGQSVVVSSVAIATAALVSWVVPHAELDDTRDFAKAQQDFRRYNDQQDAWLRQLNIATHDALGRNFLARFSRIAASMAMSAILPVAITCSALLLPDSWLRSNVAVAATGWVVGGPLMAWVVSFSADDLMSSGRRTYWVPIGFVGSVLSVVVGLVAASASPARESGATTAQNSSVAGHSLVFIGVTASGLVMVLSLCWWFARPLPRRRSCGVRGRVAYAWWLISRAMWGSVWDQGLARIARRLSALESRRLDRGWPAFGSPPVVP